MSMLIDKALASISDPGIVLLHCDKTYRPTCSSTRMISAFIPFESCEVWPLGGPSGQRPGTGGWMMGAGHDVRSDV